MRWEIAAPVTLYLVYRSYTHNSLTPFGIVTAALTAIIHALHPSPVPFTLLVLFFVLGTAATRVKKDVKASLTVSSTGSGSSSRRSSSSTAIGFAFSAGWNKPPAILEQKDKPATAAKPKNVHSVAGGQEPRSAVQVIANSGCVSLLCLLHLYLYGTGSQSVQEDKRCFGSTLAQDVILAGIISNYAAVTADTLSSELGILSSHKPRLILSFREVPPGTNGGVTRTGLGAGLAGALVIGVVSAALLPPPCEGSIGGKIGLIFLVGCWGALGSALDSILGALLQASVIDKRSGKVIEAPNGGRVKYVAIKEKTEGNERSNPSRSLGSGRDILDNNQVNFLMASVMTVGGMCLAYQAWQDRTSGMFAY